MFSRLEGKKPLRVVQAIFFVTFAAMLAMAVVAMWVPNIENSPAAKIVFATVMTILIASLLPMIALRGAGDKEKTKRGLEGLDMYTVIDRLVADVDDDEAAYLQRRLAERDASAKHELTATLGDLLDQRAEARHTNDGR